MMCETKIAPKDFRPELSNSEMITMEIVAEFLGSDTDKEAWEYFRNHWRDWFPKRGSRANFAKQAANLWNLKQRIQKGVALALGAFSDQLHR